MDRNGDGRCTSKSSGTCRDCGSQFTWCKSKRDWWIPMTQVEGSWMIIGTTAVYVGEGLGEWMPHAAVCRSRRERKRR